MRCTPQVAPGVATARLQKLVASIRPDAQTLGNHDFDYGPAVLASYIKNTTQPFVTCNIDASKDKSMRGLVKKWTLLKHSSLKIAVLGWTTPDIGGTSSSGQYITFSPVNDAVKAAVAELKAAMPNLDLIIGLSHAGGWGRVMHAVCCAWPSRQACAARTPPPPRTSALTHTHHRILLAALSSLHILPPPRL